jgi:hypothetical protein
MAVPKFCSANDVQRVTGRTYDASTVPTQRDLIKHCDAANDRLDALLRLHGIQNIDDSTFTEDAYPQAWRLCREIAAHDAAADVEAITLGQSADEVRSTVITNANAKYKKLVALVKEGGLPGYLEADDYPSEPLVTGVDDDADPLFSIEETF